MKRSNWSSCLLLLFLFTLVGYAQEEPKVPKYLTVTTMHWNMEKEDFKWKEWLAVEKEFLNKVTKKNELIMDVNIATHFLTEDNRELVYVQLFESWEAIDKSGKRNSELIKEAWPDEFNRKTFFKKRSSYYSDFHSDEIYAVLPGGKPVAEPAEGQEKEQIYYYVRKSHLAFPEDGDQKEFMEMRKKYLENVTHKNKYVKGYYPYVHAWGADRRDYIEVFAISSLGDLDKLFEEQNKLFKAAWPEEKDQKAFDASAKKYFTGFHADYVYKDVKEISK